MARSFCMACPYLHIRDNGYRPNGLLLSCCEQRAYRQRKPPKT
jgi:hypothetical protein